MGLILSPSIEDENDTDVTYAYPTLQEPLSPESLQGISPIASPISEGEIDLDSPRPRSVSSLSDSYRDGEREN